MRVAVKSQHTTSQLALPWKWQTLHDYEMRQFWHWTAFWQLQLSRRFPMLSKPAEMYLSISTCQSNVLNNITGLILNDKRSVLACWIVFHLFMTIMHTCLILNGQKTMNRNDFGFFFQWHFHWFHHCGLDCLTLTLICPACSVLYLLSFVKSMPPELVQAYSSILISNILELSYVLASYI